MKRAIKAEERKLWLAAMRDVKRRKALAARDADTELPPAPIGKTAIVKPDAPVAKRKPRAPSLVLPTALDGDTTTRLKNKTMRPQARLDLHGMTEAAAHKALTDFIHQSAKHGHRLVLIITGKGRLGQGALRRNLPLWLEAPCLRPYVAAISPAFFNDGGDGAFYIQLRK